MSEPIADLFSDRKYCLDEILRIRETIGSTKATGADFRAALKTLAFMYLHCPAEIQHFVYGQMNETNARQFYAIMAGQISVDEM